MLQLMREGGFLSGPFVAEVGLWALSRHAGAGLFRPLPVQEQTSRLKGHVRQAWTSDFLGLAAKDLCLLCYPFAGPIFGYPQPPIRGQT